MFPPQNKTFHADFWIPLVSHFQQDHSELAVGVAATMAHEMGHNFGMTHDSEGCCPASGEDGGCIMAAATGYSFTSDPDQMKTSETASLTCCCLFFCASLLTALQSPFSTGV